MHRHPVYFKMCWCSVVFENPLMKEHFFTLADALAESLRKDEIFTCNFAGEASDFVRFNQSKVRQAGHVTQAEMTINLIEGRRHASATVTLTGKLDHDRSRLVTRLGDLRKILECVPEDPFLAFATEVHSSTTVYTNTLPDSAEIVARIVAAAAGHDLVGIFASGPVQRGFANSLEQRNWYSRSGFNLDWSVYRHPDKAVKARYAGFVWEDQLFERRVAETLAQLTNMGRPVRNVAPGRYRTYLAPMAMEEILDLLCWGGFSVKSQRTGNSALMGLLEQGFSLHPSVVIKENTKDGIAPGFQEAGFVRPPEVVLIHQGRYRDALVAPRSAMEFGLPCNGASNQEAPLSLDMAPGTLAPDDILSELDNGLYVNNLWYLNYSDRNGARMTGMTRFATFWVEDGRIQGPINPMRFDETLYHLLGKHLLGLTADREFLFDPGSYGGRATRSVHVPGALIDAMNFVL
jgi:predicted Zn-dependent protease